MFREDVRGVHPLAWNGQRPLHSRVISVIRPSGIGGGLTLLSRADARILHCIGRGITDAKHIERKIGLSTKQIYARALTLKERCILEDRRGIHLADNELSKILTSFLSVSLERADVLANMGLRFLMALRDPAPGRIIAERTGVSEATYFDWYRTVTPTGIVVSDDGIHRIDHHLWPGLDRLLEMMDTESRRADGRIPDGSTVIAMDGERILFSGGPGEPYQRTAFSAFDDGVDDRKVYYTTSNNQLDEQVIFDDAVRICDATDDSDLRLRTIDYLIGNLGKVVPDNGFVRNLHRVVRGLGCKGWPGRAALQEEFGDITELVLAMMPYEGPRIPLDYRTETFRLYPNRTQKRRLQYVLDTCLILFNELRDHFLANGSEEVPSFYEIRDHMVHVLKKDSVNSPRYRDAPATVLVDVCERVHLSLSKLYEHPTPDVEPKAPEAKKRIRSFLYMQVGNGVSFPSQPDGSRKVIRFSKIGDIRYDGHTVMTDGKRISRTGRRIPFENPVPGTMKMCRVIRNNTGQWSFQITYISDRSAPCSSVPDNPRTPVGIDMGVTDLITTSEGEHSPNFRELSKIKENIAKEQSRMSRFEPRSQEWERHRSKIAHLYKHYNNRQRDRLHKLSLDLVREHDLIVFEDINIRRLIADERGKGLRFGQSEASWRKLMDMVDYKSVPMGTKVIYVDPRNTSQLCSECGYYVKKDMMERIHRCPRCGLEMDRDENAARNILIRGYERMNGANVGNRTRGLILARSSVHPYTTFATCPHHSTSI